MPAVQLANQEVPQRLVDRDRWTGATWLGWTTCRRRRSGTWRTRRGPRGPSLCVRTDVDRGCAGRRADVVLLRDAFAMMASLELSDCPTTRTHSPPGATKSQPVRGGPGQIPSARARLRVEAAVERVEGRRHMARVEAVARVRVRSPASWTMSLMPRSAAGRRVGVGERGAHVDGGVAADRGSEPQAGIPQVIVCARRTRTARSSSSSRARSPGRTRLSGPGRAPTARCASTRGSRATTTRVRDRRLRAQMRVGHERLRRGRETSARDVAAERSDRDLDRHDVGRRRLERGIEVAHRPRGRRVRARHSRQAASRRRTPATTAPATSRGD